MGFAAVHFFVSAAKGTEILESLNQPEGEAGLVAPGALTDKAVLTAASQRAGSVGDDLVAHPESGFGEDGRVFLDLTDGPGSEGRSAIAGQLRNGQTESCPGWSSRFEETPT